MHNLHRDTHYNGFCVLFVFIENFLSYSPLHCLSIHVYLMAISSYTVTLSEIWGQN